MSVNRHPVCWKPPSSSCIESNSFTFFLAMVKLSPLLCWLFNFSVNTNQIKLGPRLHSFYLFYSRLWSNRVFGCVVPGEYKLNQVGAPLLFVLCILFQAMGQTKSSAVSSLQLSNEYELNQVGVPLIFLLSFYSRLRSNRVFGCVVPSTSW